MEDINNFSIVDNYEIPSNVLNTFVSLKCEPIKQDLINALSNNNIGRITAQNTLQGFEDVKVTSDSLNKEGISAKLLESTKIKPIESNIKITTIKELKDVKIDMGNALKNLDTSWYENFNLKDMFSNLGKKLAEKYGKYFEKGKAGDAWVDLGKQVGKELLNELKDAWKNNADNLFERYNKIDTEKTKAARRKKLGIAHERSILSMSTEILTAMMISPDFMSNMYIIYLTRLDESEDPELISNLGKNPNITFVADGIDIPQVKYETFETKFLNTSIKREKPEPSITRKGSLTIRNDENFYLLSELESGSGYAQPHKWQEDTYAFYRDGKYNMEVVQLLPSEMIWEEYMADYDVITLPSRGHASFKGKTIPPSNLANLGIKAEQNTAQDISTLMFDKLDDRALGADNVRAKIYTFEEVQFLGRSNALEYKRNDASPLSSTFNFIFKQLSVHTETDPD